MNQNQTGPGSPQPLRQTHVVSCFLMRTDIDQPRLLIVRRSQHVGSYNARWAGISRLLKRGVVVEHEDAFIGRHWYIHPFLFEVLTPHAIALDWEATELRWIAPSELQDFETVPKLAEAYRSAVDGEEIEHDQRAQ